MDIKKYMEENIFALEVFDGRDWMVVSTSISETNIKYEMDQWITKGIPKDNIRVTKSQFKMDKKWTDT